MRFIKSPLGNPDVYLDGFVVMDRGVLAIPRFENHCYNMRDNSVKQQLENHLTIYHFYPPFRTDVPDVKRRHPRLFHKTREGGISEAAFVKRGAAVVIDDVVSTGTTLGCAARYLSALGYSHDEMFVFAQKYFLPEEGEKGPGSMFPYDFSHITEFADLIHGVLPDETERARLVCWDYSESSPVA